eukprot:ctg_668.g317
MFSSSALWGNAFVRPPTRSPSQTNARRTSVLRRGANVCAAALPGATPEGGCVEQARAKLHERSGGGRNAAESSRGDTLGHDGVVRERARTRFRRGDRRGRARAAVSSGMAAAHFGRGGSYWKARGGRGALGAICLVDRELEWDILELFAPLHIEEEGEWIGGNGALGAAAGDLSDVTPALPVVQAYVAALQARVAVDDTAMSTDIPCRAQAGEQERRDAVAALLFDNRHQRFAAEDYMGLLDACDSTGGGDSERAHVALAIHDLVLPTLLYREESASSVADGGYMSEALADLAQQVVRAARIPLRFLCPEYIERLRQRLRLRERAGAAGAMLELHLLRAYRENETG